MSDHRASLAGGRAAGRTPGERPAAGLDEEAIELGVKYLAARDAVVGLEAEVGVLRRRIVELEDQLAGARSANEELARQAEVQWARAEELEITSRHFHTLAWSPPGRVARVLFRPFRRLVID